MTTKLFANGLGGTLGDQLDTCKPLWTSGNVWYVNSSTGTDGIGTAGQLRERPLKTVAQAVTNATDDDVIVFLSGHSETLTAVQTIAKRLTLVGEGTVSGKPGASFSMNASSGANLFAASATNVEFRNLYFPAQVQANAFPAAKIAISAARCRIRGCYFEVNANDQFAVTFASGADQARISNSTFICTDTTLAATPAAIVSTAAINDLEIADTTLSGGAFGFAGYALDLSAGAAARCKFLGLSLLLGADVRMGASATGYVNVQTATGSSRVDWT